MRKENLRPKDWDEVTNQLNQETHGSYTSEQVRNHIDTLRKKYKKEKGKTSATGGVRSTWEYYEMVDTLWSITPRCIGIPGAMDSSSQSAPDIHNIDTEGDGREEEGGEHVEGEGARGEGSGEQEQGGTGQEDIEMQGVKAKMVKERKRASLTSFAKVLGDGMRGMSDMMVQTEKENRDHEERMLKLKMEEETKRIDIYMKYQLDLAKALKSKVCL